MDLHASFVDRMRVYLRRGVTPSRMPDSWEKLREDITRAYVAVRLTDNEHDDLMNLLMQAR